MHDKPTTAPGPLRLADHLRACCIDGQVVLLDLDRNRYLSLSGPHAKLVAGVVGAPADNPHDTIRPGNLAGEDHELAAPLLRARILTLVPGAVPHRQPQIAPSVASIDVQGGASTTAIRPLDFCRFISAVILARLWLRLRTLHAISRSIDARLRRCKPPGPDHALRLRRAVTVFDRLRPLAFTSRDQCLLDSIALALFLAHQRLSARWVIGVTTRPFRAHSWIQHEGEVLNDLHDHVRPFTPILVV